MKKIYQTLLLSCVALVVLKAEGQQTIGSYIGKDVALYPQGDAGGATGDEARTATINLKVVTVNGKTWAWTRLNNGSIDGEAGWVSQLRFWNSSNTGKQENSLTIRPSATESLGATTVAPYADGKISIFQNLIGSGFSETALFAYASATANTPVANDATAPVLSQAAEENVSQVAALLRFEVTEENDYFYHVTGNGIEEVVFADSLYLVGLTAGVAYSFQVTAIDFSGNASDPQAISFTTPSSFVLSAPVDISIGKDSVISFTGDSRALRHTVTVYRGSSTLVDYTQDVSATGGKLNFGISGTYTVAVQAVGNGVEIVSSSVVNYEWNLVNESYTPPTLGNSTTCMQHYEKILLTVEERNGLLWVVLTPLTSGENSFRAGGFQADRFTLNGNAGTWFTKTDNGLQQQVFAPTISLRTGDVIGYSGTIEWVEADNGNAYDLGFTFDKIGGSYIWGNHCLRLASPADIDIDADRKLTFSGDESADHYAIKIYNDAGVLACEQNVSSGETLPFDISGTFTVIMQSISAPADREHFDSDTSLHYTWNLVNTDRIAYPSGFLNTEAGTGNGRALWTWETVDTAVIISITAIEGKDPSKFHFRNTNGLKPENFTVNGKSNAGEAFFTVTHTNTMVTLTPLAGKVKLGDVVSYSGMVEYSTENDGNLYPTIDFGNYGLFVYGAKGFTLFPPENISVDASRVLTFTGDDEAGGYEVKIYNEAGLPVATQTVAASGKTLLYDVSGRYTLTLQSLAASPERRNSVVSAPYVWTYENEDEAQYPSTFCGFTVNPAGRGDNDKAVFTWETRDGKLVVTISDADGNFDTYFRNAGLQNNANSFKVNGVAGDWFYDGVPNGQTAGYTEIVYEPKAPINTGDQITFNGIVEYRTGLQVIDGAPEGLWPIIDFGAFGSFTWGTTCDYYPQVNVNKGQLVFSPDTGVQSFVLSAEKLILPLTIETSKGLRASPAGITPNGEGKVYPTVVSVTWEEGSSTGFVRISGGGLAFPKEIPVTSHRFSEYCNKALSPQAGDAGIYLTIAESEDKTQLSFTLTPIYGTNAQWNNIASVASGGEQTLSDKTGDGSSTVVATFGTPLENEDVVTFGGALVWTAGKANGTMDYNAYINEPQTYTVGAGGCELTTPHPAVYPKITSAVVHDRANTTATLKIATNKDAATYGAGAVRLREVNGLLPMQEVELAADSLYTLVDLEPAVTYSLEVAVVDTQGYTSAIQQISFTTRDVLQLDSFEYVVENTTYDGAEHPVTVKAKATIAAGIGNIAVKYNASDAAPVNAGKYAVTLEVAQGESFLANTFELDSFTIAKAPVLVGSLTYDTAAVTYDGAPHAVAVAAKANVTGLGSITVKYNDSEAAPADAGVYLVTVEITEGDNYLAAVGLRVGTLLIGKASTISADSFSIAPTAAAYNGTSQWVEVSVKDGVRGLGAIVSILYNGSEVAPINAGKYGVTVNLKEGDSYFASVVELTDSLEVSKAVLMAKHLTYAPKSVQYDENSHKVNVTLVTPYTGLGEVAVKYNGSEIAPVEVGIYKVTVSAREGDNFSATTEDVEVGDFVVSRKAVVTLAELDYAVASATYDGAPHAVPVTAKQGVALGGITVLYNNNVTAPVSAGRYVIKVAVEESDAYAPTELELPDTLDIFKAPVVVGSLTYDTAAITYDGAPHAVAVSAGENVIGLGRITVKYNGSEVSPAEVGAYLVTMDISEGDNYLAAVDLRLGTLVIAEAVIAKIPVTLAELDYAVAAATYDGAPHAAPVTAKQGVALGGITVLYNNNATAPVSAGRYVIKVVVEESDAYASTELELPDTLDIFKASVVVGSLTYDTAAVTYDGAPHAVAVSANENVTGLGSITVKYNGSEVAPAEVGAYLVTVDISEGDNYLTAVDLRLGTLVIAEADIAKIPVTLAELDYTVAAATYDGAPHAVPVTAKQGVALGGITVLYNNNATAPVSAGRYVIKVVVEESDAYALTELELPDTLDIFKAEPSGLLLDYAINDSIEYDSASHAITVVGKENVTGLGSITVKYNGSETAPIDTGTYLVTVDIAEGDNYLSALDIALYQFVIYAASTVEKPTAVEPSSASALSAYAVKGSLHIIGEVKTVRILNVSGSLVLSARATGSNTLNVAHLPTGVYFVVLQGKSETRVVKLQVVN